MPCGTAHPIDGIDLWRYSRLHRWEPGNWSGSRFTSMYSRKAAPYRRSELASRRRRMGCKTFVLHAWFPGPGRHPSLINESKGVPPSSVLPRRTSSMALCSVTLRFLNRSPAPERGSGAFALPTVRSKPPASPRTPPALHRSAGPAPGSARDGAAVCRAGSLPRSGWRTRPGSAVHAGRPGRTNRRPHPRRRDELGQEGDVEHAHLGVEQVGQQAAPEGLTARCRRRLERARVERGARFEQQMRAEPDQVGGAGELTRV